ncbi:uncharacterized protein CMU_041660 [Cryptosporidium muris RN66]|uniref:Uncharacterized protein n=1 Tax=Cryptosporidium muris (strain RN66) TaxID=441375 RepID=B6AA53_CRYMR|nr:uncharacterized protein CMU_041660 [Cryptosporidium muris RN66]EEA05094.1 hypothetical protein CMU_041660 [Cryptosporidium muris RN66]|eukprot:XP_002139443.1 hypothetical protein [Cryptosporidium muris RN66]
MFKKLALVLCCLELASGLSVYHLTNPFDLLQGLSHAKLEYKTEKPISYKTIKFLQTQIQKVSEDEEIKQGLGQLSQPSGTSFRESPLSQEAFKLQSNILFAEATEKRKIAKYLQEQSGISEGELSKTDFNEEKFPEKKAAIANAKRAKVLLAQAYILEEEAKKMQIAAQKAEAGSSKQCDILKIGPLAFVPNSEEVTDIMDGSLGFLNGNMLTLYFNTIPKASFALEGIELPVYNVDAAPGCLGFKYHGVDQVLCGLGKDSQVAWINAITEAWFCRNVGLAGTLPSIEASKRQTEKSKSVWSLSRPAIKTITIGLEDGKPKVTEV